MAENKDQNQKLGMREHWKALLIVTLVSLSSFQYGLDFGIIGGLQAMIGFLEVRIVQLTPELGLTTVDLWGESPVDPSRVEHQCRTTATHLFVDDPRCLHFIVYSRAHSEIFWPQDVALDRLHWSLRFYGRYANYDADRGPVCRKADNRLGEWPFDDACTAIYSSKWCILLWSRRR